MTKRGVRLFATVFFLSIPATIALAAPTAPPVGTAVPKPAPAAISCSGFSGLGTRDVAYTCNPRSDCVAQIGATNALGCVPGSGIPGVSTSNLTPEQRRAVCNTMPTSGTCTRKEAINPYAECVSRAPAGQSPIASLRDAHDAGLPAPNGNRGAVTSDCEAFARASLKVCEVAYVPHTGGPCSATGDRTPKPLSACNCH
ncbi:MAG: hypothetical protein JWM74_255 [Myxococcaceae bacterium]|nr:hypothetical protein [Myxococcaceae bacterium]